MKVISQNEPIFIFDLINQIETKFLSLYSFLSNRKLNYIDFGCGFPFLAFILYNKFDLNILNLIDKKNELELVNSFWNDLIRKDSHISTLQKMSFYNVYCELNSEDADRYRKLSELEFNNIFIDSYFNKNIVNFILEMQSDTKFDLIVYSHVFKFFGFNDVKLIFDNLDKIKAKDSLILINHDNNSDVLDYSKFKNLLSERFPCGELYETYKEGILDQIFFINIPELIY